MSIRDKVRDSLYGGRDADARNEEAAMSIANFTDKLERPFPAVKTLILCLVVEAAIIAIQIFAPWVVMYLMTLSLGLFRLAALGTFALGYLIAYTSIRIIRSLRTLKDADQPIESGVMSGFSYEIQRERRMFTWLICAAAGALNTIALFLMQAAWA